MSSPRRGGGPGLLSLALGLVAAQAAFAWTFRGPRRFFWPRMTLTGLALASYALAASAEARRVRIGPAEALAGAASAAVLYATFRIGDRFARRVMPDGEREVRDVYALRMLEPRSRLALRLGAVIGPAEELFWRGLVQASLMRRWGRWRGAAAATAAYGGVHLVTGNLTLAGAATVAGAHWGLLRAAGVPLGALIVSHAAWDVWIFLLAPTERQRSAAPPTS